MIIRKGGGPRTTNDGGGKVLRARKVRIFSCRRKFLLLPGTIIPSQTNRTDRTFFFFSSRRRHTRLTCDWSSDVCSSDLADPRRGVRLNGECRVRGRYA